MNNDKLKRIEDLLEVLVKIKLSSVFKSELSEPKMLKLYEMTGKFLRNQISKEIGFSNGKISNIWQEWERKGILRKEGKKYKKTL